MTCRLSLHGADMSMADYDGRTALHLASEGGHLPLLGELVSYRQQLSHGDLHGWTVLHMEAMSGRCSSVRHLLSCGADVNRCDNDGWTPLHSAVFYGDRATIEAIARHRNCDVSATCRPDESDDKKITAGMTPASMAEKFQKQEAINFFKQFQQEKTAEAKRK